MKKYRTLILVVLAAVFLGVVAFRLSPHSSTLKLPAKTPDSAAIVSRLTALGQFETASTTITTGPDQGTVTAGVDLTTVTDKDFAIDGKHIQLNLAPPRLFKMTLVKGSQDGLRKAVCAENILAKASDNAAKSLGDLLKSLGFTGSLVMITEPLGC